MKANESFLPTEKIANQHQSLFLYPRLEHFFLQQLSHWIRTRGVTKIIFIESIFHQRDTLARLRPLFEWREKIIKKENKRLFLSESQFLALSNSMGKSLAKNESSCKGVWFSFPVKIRNRNLFRLHFVWNRTLSCTSAVLPTGYIDVI